MIKMAMEDSWIVRETSQIIREIRINTAMRYHLTPVSLATMKKEKTSAGEDVEKLQCLCTVVENIKWCSLYG